MPKLPQWWSGTLINGLLLILATLLAMILANSALSAWYFALLTQPLVITDSLPHNLLSWINDGAMAIFFLYIGLEVRQELCNGSLSNARAAALPVLAATGGMIVPAIIFWVINLHQPQNSAGWAIPMATDIAFALGLLALAGPGVPPALRTFLMALAVIDDLGAIIVIALFYTRDLHLTALLAACVIIVALGLCNWLKIKSLMPRFLLALLLWYSVLMSGIHPTIAGVISGLLIPVTANLASPASRLANQLAPWVNKGLLPLFALANAGVNLSAESAQPILNLLAVGIIAGLVVGKPLGISLFCWAGLRAGWVKLAEGCRCKDIVQVSVLCGIGFTMSIFIASLAFQQSVALDKARLAILIASLIAGTAGCLWLKFARRVGADHNGGERHH